MLFRVCDVSVNDIDLSVVVFLRSGVDVTTYRYIFNNLVLPMLLTCIVAAGVLFFVLLLFHRSGPLVEIAGTIFTFCLLGSVCGFCIGDSREAAVGTVLPALLTLISGICVFAFTKEGLKDLRPSLPYALTGLLLTSIYWSGIGATLRLATEDRINPATNWAKHDWEEFLIFEKDLEFAQADRMRAAGLSSPVQEVKNVTAPPTAVAQAAPSASSSGHPSLKQPTFEDLKKKVERPHGGMPGNLLLDPNATTPFDPSLKYLDVPPPRPNQP